MKRQDMLKCQGCGKPLDARSTKSVERMKTKRCGRCYLLFKRNERKHSIKKL